MQDLINRLEALSGAWKEQFDNPPDLSFSWEIDAQTGVLSLNGKGICPAASIAPEGESYDVEYLFLKTNFGDIGIFIEWPYDGEATVKEVTAHLSNDEYMALVERFDKELKECDGRMDILYAKYSNQRKQLVNDGFGPADQEFAIASGMVDIIADNIIMAYMARSGWGTDLDDDSYPWFQPTKEDILKGRVFSTYKIHLQEAEK